MAHVTFVTSGAACVGGTLQFENHAAVTGFVISVPPKTDDRCVTFAYHRPPTNQHHWAQKLREPFQVSSSAPNSKVARMSEKLQNTMALVAPLITAAETMGKAKKTK